MTWTRRTSPRTLAALSLFAAACSGNSSRDDAGGECATALLPGDIVISELMINPEGADAGKEWIELYNPTDAEVDLSGVLLRFRRANGESEKIHQIQGLSIGAGEYLVLGDADPDNLPEHVDYGYGDDLGQGLSSQDGEVSVGCGTSAVDIMTYGFGDNSPIDEVPDNTAWGFDGTREPDALSNDDIAAWCLSATVYSAEQPGTEGESAIPEAFGTPGEPNDPCYSDRPTECNDNGAPRAVVPPAPGDIVITEYMANPHGPDDDEDDSLRVDDDDGEWFELYVGADVDLNGLTITKFGDEDPNDIIGSVDCLHVEAGTHVLFAHSSDTDVNGGLPAVDFEFTMGMSNSSEMGTGFSVGWGGEELDTVMWTDSGQGASSQLDPMFRDPVRNDEDGAFCESEFPYGLGDLGTPGEANPRCPFPGSCIEDRDRRAIVSPSAGDLWITEFMADPAAVGDGDGEWFEVYADAAFDLNGLEFGRDEEIEETVDVEECIPVQQGDYVLFTRNADQATNGGLPAADYEVGFSLVNNAGGALYLAVAGEVLDAISWEDTEAGMSRALSPDVSGPDANDNEANWCNGNVSYGDGDFGTPAEANSACGGTPAGTCDEGAVTRDLVVPTAGDLVITEWMPNPAAVGDTEGEWFEVLVTADVDLNGLQLGNNPESPSTTLPATGDCIPATAGTRVVFARNADSMTNGGVMNAIEASFTLGNSGGTVFVGYADEVLDQVDYTSSSDGSSTSVSPGSEDTASNDNEGNHCTSNTPYGDGDNGTPGAENACG